MSLIDLIRSKSAPSPCREKGDSSPFATATRATFATQVQEHALTVASVATVAVATPAKSIPDPTTALKKEGGTSDETVHSRWWLVHFQDRSPLEVACSPEATHEEMLGWYPDAVSAQRFTPRVRAPSMPLTAREERSIRGWLSVIEEPDLAIINQVLRQCQNDADARVYFLRRAAAEPRPDDRRTCSQCVNFMAGRCLARDQKALNLHDPMHGMHNILHRCVCYVPKLDDYDRRLGSQRWVGPL